MFPGKPAFTTTLTNGTSVAQGVFIEMFLTAELVFTVLMLAAEKSKATFIAPGRLSLSSFPSAVLYTSTFAYEIAADAEYSNSGYRACFVRGGACRYAIHSSRTQSDNNR